MPIEGGCFCGAVRFAAEGPLLMRGLCLCRTCQKISGGGGNLFVAVEAAGFAYTAGEPARFQRAPDAPMREFCGDCGVQLTARSQRAPTAVLLKVGALDDPALYEGPELVVWTDEKQPFHLVPPGVPAYGRMPSPPPAGAPSNPGPKP
ncbi:MAG: GFA family protein [Phenylobacterium sp.]